VASAELSLEYVISIELSLDHDHYGIIPTTVVSTQLYLEHVSTELSLDGIV